MAEENINEAKSNEEQPKEEQSKEAKKDLKKDIKALNAQIKELQAQLEQTQKESAEKIVGCEAKAKDDYLRLMAEFDNYRRRTAQEKLDLVSVAARSTIEGMLPVLDDCERALKLLADSDANQAAKEGTELIYNKLMTYLKSKGLEVIEALGLPFDTELHEAIAEFPVEDEERKGKVIDVAVTGYKLNGTVIRYAKVVVGK